MALFAILRNTGTTIVRAPLLWFFSAIFLLTNDAPSLGLSDSLCLGYLSLLLIPIAVLAEAGQIRSVQLHHKGTPTSVSQIIRHGARRMGPLIVVLVVTVLLTFLLVGVLGFVVRSLFPQMSRSDPLILIFISAITSAITYPFMAFAQCAIVISGLPLSSSLPMIFRAVKKDAFTVLTLVAAYGLLRYFIVITFPVIAANPVRIAGYMLALLIVGGIQSAAFTFAYLYCVGEAEEETTTARPAT